MKVVIDTNVLVSGLLGLYTYPARVIDLVYINRLRCVYDDRIMTEYRQVLARPKFKYAFSPQDRKHLLDFIAQSGIHVLAAPLDKFTVLAPHEDDLPFVETAAAAKADFIVTGNQAHFEFFTDNPWGIQILSPHQCYELMCRP